MGGDRKSEDEMKKEMEARIGEYCKIKWVTPTDCRIIVEGWITVSLDAAKWINHQIHDYGEKQKLLVGVWNVEWGEGCVTKRFAFWD